MSQAAKSIVIDMPWSSPASRSWLGRLLSQAWVRAVIALVLVFALGLIFDGNGAFHQWGTHRDMLRQVSVYGVLACGMTLVIVTGGIDLAVGSILALSAVLFSLFTLHWGWSAPVALGACLLTGLSAGLVSGSGIAYMRLQPFIATLATMVFARGLAKFVTGGEKISRSVATPDGSFQYVELPAIFSSLDLKILGGNLTVVTLIFAACALLCWVVMAKLRWGRFLIATGGNEEAARLSGVPVQKTKLWAYGASGALAAVAGICQAAQEQQGDPEAGLSYELTAIAMVVIGGTRLTGGRGGIGLTLLGVLTIGYLEKILSINAVGEASRLMLTGAILIAAVVLQRSKANN